MRNKSLLVVVATGFWGLFVLACGSDKGGGDEVEAPLRPAAKTTVATYGIRPLGEAPTVATFRYEGQEAFAGGTWDRYRATYPVAAGTKTVDYFGTDRGNGRVTAAGLKVTFPPGTLAVNYTVTLDPPVSLDIEAIPVGVEQVKAVSGTFQAGGVAQGIAVAGTVRFTKTDDNATVESQFGVISGVRVFQGTATLDQGEGWPSLDLFKGQTISGTVWYHPTFGLVKAESPDWNIGTFLTGEEDCGNPAAEDYNTIQKVGMVSAENPSFVLSSKDCSGAFDADKNRHAKMLLELRWAEDDRAKTADQPMVNVSFETAWGMFPFALVSSPVSIFHPEEAGKGYTYWYALVDEAAKNEPGENGILYKVAVSYPDYMTSPVRVTARIRYPIYRP